MDIQVFNVICNGDQQFTGIGSQWYKGTQFTNPSTYKRWSIVMVHNSQRGVATKITKFTIQFIHRAHKVHTQFISYTQFIHKLTKFIHKVHKPSVYSSYIEEQFTKSGNLQLSQFKWFTSSQSWISTLKVESVWAVHWNKFKWFISLGMLNSTFTNSLNPSWEFVESVINFKKVEHTEM